MTAAHARIGTVLAAGLLALGPAAAQERSDGRTTAVKPADDVHPLEELWSGYHYASEEARALQDDAFANPAMTLYRAGRDLWSKEEGRANESCKGCHGSAATSMKGAAPQYPAVYAPAGALLTLAGRINLCREKFMQARPWEAGSEELLAMTIYVKRQSRGSPLDVKVDGSAAPFFDKGKAFFNTRRGQLNLACSHCHEKSAGRKYRARTLSQGQVNGFPVYRTSWGATGTLLRQVNMCLGRLRAEPLKAGSGDIAALELYLAWRGQGLPIETPAVRD